MREASAVDLFCGVGGLTHGFVKEGVRVVAGIDIDSSCKYAYEKNNNAIFVEKGIDEITPEEIVALYPQGHLKILIGCAPCQTFSLYNHKISKGKKTQEKDSKWKLLYSFANLIEKVKPEIVSMENVPQLVKFDNGQIFNDFVESLQKLSYKVTWSIVNAQDYEVPQRRKRLILFASKYGKVSLVGKFIEDGNPITVRDAIGHLPPIEDGTAHPEDSLHRARKLSELNKRRIQATKEGGFWRDWDDTLKLNCQKTESEYEFSSVYGRMKWDDVAPTITTHCIGLSNGRFGHPNQDRAMTLREAALLQSFPENYKFIDPALKFNSSAIARHIGNAVPVGLGIAIARSIKVHIEEIGKS